MAVKNGRRTVEIMRCANEDCKHAATSHIRVIMIRNHNDESGLGRCSYSRCPCVYYRPKEKI